MLNYQNIKAQAIKNALNEAVSLPEPVTWDHDPDRAYYYVRHSGYIISFTQVAVQQLLVSVDPVHYEISCNCNRFFTICSHMASVLYNRREQLLPWLDFETEDEDEDEGQVIQPLAIQQANEIRIGRQTVLNEAATLDNLVATVRRSRKQEVRERILELRRRYETPALLKFYQGIEK